MSQERMELGCGVVVQGMRQAERKLGCAECSDSWKLHMKSCVEICQPWMWCLRHGSRKMGRRCSVVSLKQPSLTGGGVQWVSLLHALLLSMDCAMQS